MKMEIKSKRIKIHGSGIEINYKPTHYIFISGLLMFMGYIDDPETEEDVFIDSRGRFHVTIPEFPKLEDFISVDYRKLVDEAVEEWNKECGDG